MKGYLHQKGRTWYTTIDLPRQRGEKRRQREFRIGIMSKGAARQRERVILRQADENKWTDDGRKTVSDLLRLWLMANEPTETSQMIAPTTYERYKSFVKLHLDPALGSIPLKKLAPSHVAVAYEQIRKKGLSGRTCLHAHRVLHAAMAYGVKTLRLIAENPVANVPAPRADKRTMTVNASQVLVAIEGSKGTRLETPVLLTALTGLRRGEVLALRWSTSVDFERNRLVVAEALEETKTFGIRFKKPKSGRVRVVPLADAVVQALGAHKSRQDQERLAAGLSYIDNDLVFPNLDGSVWPPDTFTKQFSQTAASLGLKGFRFHDIRHAFASLTLTNGASFKEVQELLGHSSPTITLSTYAHVMEGVAHGAVNQLAASLGYGGQANP